MEFRSLYGENELIDEFIDRYDGTMESALEILGDLSVGIDMEKGTDIYSDKYKKEVLEFARFLSNHYFQDKEEINKKMNEKWGEIAGILQLSMQLEEEKLSMKVDEAYGRLSEKAKANVKLLEDYILNSNGLRIRITCLSQSSDLVFDNTFNPEDTEYLQKYAGLLSTLLFAYGGALRLEVYIEEKKTIVIRVGVKKDGTPVIFDNIPELKVHDDVERIFQTAQIDFLY